MASAQLSEGLPIGTILWIKKLAYSEDGDSHGLPLDYFMHPCVVLHLPISMEGFAQIFVITSKSSRNINDLPLPARIRQHYTPIHPTPFNALLPSLQLHLTSPTAKLRKDSYVNTQKVYALPFSKLERYDRKRPVTDFCLDAPSIHWLRQKAFGDLMFSDIPISPDIFTTASTSVPDTGTTTTTNPYADTFRPLPRPYGATELQYPVVHAPAVLPAAARLPTGTRASRDVSTPSARARPRRPRNVTRRVVGLVGVLIILATAALLIFSLALWAFGGLGHVACSTFNQRTLRMRPHSQP